MDITKVISNLSKDYPSKATDFDFLLGKWKVKNKIWQKINTASDTYELKEFKASLNVRKILGGYGQFDEYKTKRFEASTLRIFNPKTHLWSLYWVDDRNCELDIPQVGTFKHDTGEFFSESIIHGQKTILKFLWSDITGLKPKWEQKLSIDNGESWRINWKMEFIKEPEK